MCDAVNIYIGMLLSFNLMTDVNLDTNITSDTIFMHSKPIVRPQTTTFCKCNKCNQISFFGHVENRHAIGKCRGTILTTPICYTSIRTPVHAQGSLCFSVRSQCFHVPYSALTMFISGEQKERDSATAYRKS